MAKPGRPSKKQEEKDATFQSETPDSTIVKEEKSGIAEQEKGRPEIVAAQDCWRYHLDEAPRIFRKGEIIPEGWTDDAAVRKLWTCDPFGKFSKVKG